MSENILNFLKLHKEIVIFNHDGLLLPRANPVWETIANDSGTNLKPISIFMLFSVNRFRVSTKLKEFYITEEKNSKKSKYWRLILNCFQMFKC